ncbi:MAG: hypothetical protein ABSH22_00660, partial [Tepidisphaeraceae bacterium]
MSPRIQKRQRSTAALAAAGAVAASLVAAAVAQAGSTTQPSGGVGGTNPFTGSPYDAPIAGNSNGNQYATISLSGSTAMRAYTTSPGISLLPENTDIFLSSGTFYGPTGPGGAYQLAPVVTTAQSTGNPADVPALEVQWHEQGSVEGILEMVSDQIAPPTSAPLSLVNRSPSPANPVWINENKFGASDLPLPQPPQAPTNGWAIDNFSTTSTPNEYQQSPVQMAISDVKPIQGFAYTTSLPTAPAINPSASAWQMQPGQAGYGMGNPALPLPPSNNNGGLGLAAGREQLTNQSQLDMQAGATNPVTGGTFGSGPWNTGGVTNLQTNTVAITATDFASNPGTGLTGLNKTDAQWLQLTGRLQNGATFNMSTRDVNSGTRNTAANNTGIDPSWAVGANDSGNTLATNSATTIAADAQDSIGHDANGNPTMRFSGKTSGALLRQTIENNRMGVGTLSLPDTLSGSTTSSPTPINALAYNPNPSTDTADQQPIDFVYPTAQTIINGSYVIWQQEQYVTVKAPNSADASETAAQWAATSDLQTGIQGDTPNTSATLDAQATTGSNQLTDSGDKDIAGGGFVIGQTITSPAFPAGTTVTGVTYNAGGTVQSVTLSNAATSNGDVDFTVSSGDVADFRANILNAQKIAGGTTQYSSVDDPGDQLVAQKFILPQFMAVQKAYDGGPVTPNSTFDINNNPTGYDAAYSSAFLSSSLETSFNPAGVGPLMTNAGGTMVSTLINSTPLTVPNAKGSGGYYGESVRSASTTVGSSIGAQGNVAFADGDIGITTSSYLFGNFNNNGVRDFSSFETGVYALKALYNSGLGTDANDNLGKTNDGQEIPDSVLNAVEPGLASVLGSTSSFVGQRGSSDLTNPNDIAVAPVTAKGVSKGDLIVMGDYNGAGEFNGQDIYDLAIGTTLSDPANVGITPTLGVADLTSDASLTNGVLNKNAALNFVQTQTSDATYSSGVATNASAFIRQSGRAVLVASSPATVPSGATDLGLQSVSGGEEFTYDPTGAYAFNSADVNRAGLVDFNDAVIVDSFIGQSYTNLADSLAATIPTPVTGTPEPVSLAVVQQVDGESAISQTDLNVVNSQLTGTGNANWYGYNVDKTGPGTINWQRTGGTVTVYSGASFTIGGGTV